MTRRLRSVLGSCLTCLVFAFGAHTLADPPGGGGPEYCCWYTYDFVLSHPWMCGYYGNNFWFRSGP